MNKTTLYRLTRRYGQYTGSDEILDDALVTAEARIGRDLRTTWNNTAAAILLGDGEEYAELPADFRNFQACWDTFGKEEWHLRDRRALHEAEEGQRADRVCAIGLQPFLSVDSLILQFYPLPTVGDILGGEAEERRVVVWYWCQPATITDAARASHPASVFPELYIQAMLMDVARIRGDNAALELATAQYAAALDLANMTRDGTENDSGGAMPAYVIGG